MDTWCYHDGGGTLCCVYACIVTDDIGGVDDVVSMVVVDVAGVDICVMSCGTCVGWYCDVGVFVVLAVVALVVVVMPVWC